MQDCDTKKKSTTQAALPISTLFKPRQVLLNSISNMKSEIQNGTKSKTLISLTNDQRTLLLQSICQFLDQNGFSKSLKHFRKEADVENESSKSCLLNLEEMCCQFLKNRNETKVNDGSIKEQAGETVKGIKENDGDEVKKSEAKVENVSDDGVDVKKKKKKSKKASDLSEQTANAEDVSLSVPSAPEHKSKEKKKKKSKDDVQEEKKDSVQVKVGELPVEETLEKPNAEDVSLSVPSEPEKKSKDKKKKKSKDDIQEEKKGSIQVKLDELPVEETLEKPNSVSQVEKEKSKSRKKKEDSLETIDFDKEKKGSKKRKKSSSEENDIGHVEEPANDDAKRRKTDNIDLSHGTCPKTPNGIANGVLENGNTGSKKDKSRQRNDSAEPRTSANAFRRVKEEEVEFVDEKLQDNSYWAKDGADSGYGAKAQEVLGQVRGRDFRHEKTKKKRGSYRGGQIDLHSHSFKFNYDDDEE